LFGQVHAYAFLNLQYHVTAFPMLLQVGHSSIAIAMTLLALSVELLGDV
jgi:hypothetical protein